MAKFKGAIKTCGECGKEFKVPPSRATKALYCSNECAYKHRMEGRRKRVTLLCEACGGRFEAVECHVDRRRFCSNRCRNSDLSYRASIVDRTLGAQNAAWKGGRVPHPDGYVYVRATFHPFASNGYVLEHRLVMEDWLRQNDPASKFLVTLGGQLYLSPGFDVHHDDENKANNVIGNLVCMTSEEHARHHNDGKFRRKT